VAAVPEGRAAATPFRLREPEGEATRLLYERHQRKILSFCQHQLGNREEAEDATQITFMNAFRGLKRGTSPEFEAAWLYKIAHNVCLTKQRNSYRRRLVEAPSDFELIEELVPAHEGDSDELFGLGSPTVRSRTNCSCRRPRSRRCSSGRDARSRRRSPPILPSGASAGGRG
jgi:RNA polymerase sigma factor (sigma-70 family)